MNPPTWFDDATVLLDVNRVLQAAHVETFIAAKEQIENNAEGNGTLTDMKGAEAVFKRFEKRLVAKIKANPKAFTKMDLINVQTRQTDVRGSGNDGFGAEGHPMHSRIWQSTQHTQYKRHNNNHSLQSRRQ